MPRLSVLALAGLALAGCAPASAPKASVPAANERRIVAVGGVGGDATGTFDVAGRTVRIAYRLSRAPTGGRVTFVLERDAGGVFGASSSDSEIVPDSLSGSRSLPVVPGHYRLRVDTDVAWTAEIYEPRP